MFLEGAGQKEVNGKYRRIDDYQGKPQYKKGDIIVRLKADISFFCETKRIICGSFTRIICEIYWGNMVWYVYDKNSRKEYYRNLNDFPLAPGTGWMIDEAPAPAPNLRYEYTFKDHSVFLEAAGNKEIRGKYERDGNFDGKPQYKKGRFEVRLKSRPVHHSPKLFVRSTGIVNSLRGS